jgi:SAM-dependent methyltransferase
MSLVAHWDRQYREGQPVWDSDRPTSELVRVVQGEDVAPCHALELGCGTGTNAVWLAGRGFTVTAIDLSPEAIGRARQRSHNAGVEVRFLQGDLRRLSESVGPFDFFVDCGCFGAVQRADVRGYLDALARLTRTGALGLVLTGNDAEPPDGVGPPGMSAEQLRADFEGLFDVVRLRPFRFDADQGNGKEYLGWSCLLRRRA